jgi:hypothetical protein
MSHFAEIAECSASTSEYLHTLRDARRWIGEFGRASHCTYDPACPVSSAFVYDQDFIETRSYTSDVFWIASNSFDPEAISTWPPRRRWCSDPWVALGSALERRVRMQFLPQVPLVLEPFLS